VPVLDGQGLTLAKRKALPTVESLSEIETAALAGTSCGARLEVVMEPTGPAWLPIAVFFISRGHVVYRVSSAESADLRRYLSKHAKSNGIDADTLARIPLFNRRGCDPSGCPGLRPPGWHAGSGPPTG
jgi:transposase